MMSVMMDDPLKRWTAKRTTARVVEIIPCKTTVAEASQTHALPPSEIEGWIENTKRGMEDALRANPLDIGEQYEKQLKNLQGTDGAPVGIGHACSLVLMPPVARPW